ncbi:hypothetical protein BCR39DRAFT_591241 [Naematelia encephala]|uniref:BTB domain-containing protein n=1 Tax=Naematelia encephala TaxID=71784 RepID=A0A1Y2AJ73_9TREE|nr:hypothetical protein BCR39DRAFT_591241 [Naematelia encephala]
MSNTGLEPTAPTSSSLERWDDRYDDPEAKIVLISSDHAGFRLSAWYLAKESKLVSDLVAPSGIDKDAAHSPIQLDAPSYVVRAFADLVTSSHPLQLLEFTKRDYVSLFHICDLMQSPSLAMKIRESLIQRSLNHPWEIFELASQRNDVDLAREAIRNMGNEVHSPAIRLPHFKDGDLDGVSVRFVLGLVRARLGLPVEMQHTRHPHTTEWACTVRDWIDTAEAFEA